jgi:hypothetical protein
VSVTVLLGQGAVNDKIDCRIIVLKAVSILAHSNLLLMFGGSPLTKHLL